MKKCGKYVCLECENDFAFCWNGTKFVFSAPVSLSLYYFSLLVVFSGSKSLHNTCATAKLLNFSHSGNSSQIFKFSNLFNKYTLFVREFLFSSRNCMFLCSWLLFLSISEVRVSAPQIQMNSTLRSTFASFHWEKLILTFVRKAAIFFSAGWSGYMFVVFRPNIVFDKCRRLCKTIFHVLIEVKPFGFGHTHSKLFILTAELFSCRSILEHFTLFPASHNYNN